MLRLISLSSGLGGQSSLRHTCPPLLFVPADAQSEVVQKQLVLPPGSNFCHEVEEAKFLCGIGFVVAVEAPPLWFLSVCGPHRNHGIEKTEPVHQTRWNSCSRLPLHEKLRIVSTGTSWPWDPSLELSGVELGAGKASLNLLRTSEARSSGSLGVCFGGFGPVQ